MLGRGRRGGFRRRDRVLCHTCKGTFCTKCLGPTADLCLTDYAVRYAPSIPRRAERYRRRPRDAEGIQARPLHPQRQLRPGAQGAGRGCEFVDAARIERRSRGRPRPGDARSGTARSTTKRALFGALTAATSETWESRRTSSGRICTWRFAWACRSRTPSAPRRRASPPSGAPRRPCDGFLPRRSTPPACSCRRATTGSAEA